jgi:hypothetical protein
MSNEDTTGTTPEELFPGRADFAQRMAAIAKAREARRDDYRPCPECTGQGRAIEGCAACDFTGSVRGPRARFGELGAAVVALAKEVLPSEEIRELGLRVLELEGNLRAAEVLASEARRRPSAEGVAIAARELLRVQPRCSRCKEHAGSWWIPWASYRASFEQDAKWDGAKELVCSTCVGDVKSDPRITRDDRADARAALERQFDIYDRAVAGGGT